MSECDGCGEEQGMRFWYKEVIGVSVNGKYASPIYGEHEELCFNCYRFRVRELLKKDKNEQA